MNHHPHFTRKSRFVEQKEQSYFEIMKKYPNGEFRIVAYGLSVEDNILVGYDKENKPIYKPVKEIKEQHVSAGDFEKYDRPQSYRVAV